MTIFEKQTFGPEDLLILLILIGLDFCLSLDNIIIFANFCKKIDPQKRNHLLLTGTICGSIFRLIAFLLLATFVKMIWIPSIIGIYLIYTALKGIIGQKKGPQIHSPSFWLNVFKIELIDFLLAIDSVVAAFALLSLYYTQQEILSKLWMIYISGIITLLIIRKTSLWITPLLRRYTILEKTALWIIFFLGIQMILSSF